MWPSATSSESVTTSVHYAIQQSEPSFFHSTIKSPNSSFSSLQIPLIPQTASSSLDRGSPSQRCRPRSMRCRHLVCAKLSPSRGRQLNDLFPGQRVLLSFRMSVLGFTCRLSLRRRDQFPLTPGLDGNFLRLLTLNGRYTLDGGHGDGRLSCMLPPGCSLSSAS